MRCSRASRVYRSAALLFCNTLVLLVALNALLSVLFHVKDALFPETNLPQRPTMPDSRACIPR